MSIRLSKKHGVNPAIPLCFFCNKPKDEIILAGRLPGDGEAPHAAVWDERPCDECAGYMRAGVILISCRDGESGGNLYRTGGWCVITDSAARKLFDEKSADAICKSRVSFVHDEAWNKLGLPRGEVADAS